MRTEHVHEFIFPGSFMAEFETRVVPNGGFEPPDWPTGGYGPAMGFRRVVVNVLETKREDGLVREERVRVTEGPWMYYGDELTLEVVRRRHADDPKRWRILLGNMEGNGYARCVFAGMTIPISALDVVTPVDQRPPLAS